MQQTLWKTTYLAKQSETYIRPTFWPPQETIYHLWLFFHRPSGFFSPRYQFKLVWVCHTSLSTCFSLLLIGGRRRTVYWNPFCFGLNATRLFFFTGQEIVQVFYLFWEDQSCGCWCNFSCIFSCKTGQVGCVLRLHRCYCCSLFLPLDTDCGLVCTGYISHRWNPLRLPVNTQQKSGKDYGTTWQKCKLTK